MRELKRRMPYSDFLNQYQHYIHFPWGDDWEQAATVAMVARQDTKRPKAIKDIIPDRRPQEAQPRQSAQQMFNLLAASARAHNRRLRRAGKHHNTEGTTDP